MSTAATRKTVECRSVEGVCKQLEKLPVEKPAACSRERRWSQQLPPGRWRALLGLRGGCNHLMPWCSSHHGVRLLQLPEGLIAPSSKTGVSCNDGVMALESALCKHSETSERLLQQTLAQIGRSPVQRRITVFQLHPYSLYETVNCGGMSSKSIMTESPSFRLPNFHGSFGLGYKIHELKRGLKYKQYKRKCQIKNSR
ncbi:uncharacterized protein LOC142775806 isoform X2 [Rhipicephalus microplus]|uniref:uncharacterized protein LOC142775806 isoform X2 n=1 Tax=Rhipicephalus microplus TaxID=6941 RepID=UPI003F6C2D90